MTPTDTQRVGGLVAVARLVEDSGLPAPQMVRFLATDDGRSHLNLNFDTAEQAEAWARYLDTPGDENTYQPTWREGPIRSVTAYARPALGFDIVSVHGWTPVAREVA